jgi:hypothetical protein
MLKLIPVMFCFFSLASFAKDPVDLSTPLVEKVAGHFEGSFSPDEIQVSINFDNIEVCRGGDCYPEDRKLCHFSLSPLPLKDETGTLNTNLPFFLSEEQRIELRDVVADQRSDCDGVVEKWKAQLPNSIHYSVDLIERTWVDWDTYANPAICRRNHVFYRKMEVEKMGSGEPSSFKRTEELLNINYLIFKIF